MVWVEVLCALVLLGVLAARRSRAAIVGVAILLGVAIGFNSAMSVSSVDGGGEGKEERGGGEREEREVERWRGVGREGGEERCSNMLFSSIVSSLTHLLCPLLGLHMALCVLLWPCCCPEHTLPPGLATLWTKLCTFVCYVCMCVCVCVCVCVCACVCMCVHVCYMLVVMSADVRHVVLLPGLLQLFCVQ